MVGVTGSIPVVPTTFPDTRMGPIGPIRVSGKVVQNEQDWPSLANLHEVLEKRGFQGLPSSTLAHPCANPFPDD